MQTDPLTAPLSTPLSQWHAVAAALQRLRQGEASAHAFSEAVRQQEALLAALPARYAEVLHGLLDRLESGALFSEESCSFSQKDLVDSLQIWVDKADAALQPQG